jgi:hypothetical protein
MIEITPENHEELYATYSEQLLSGKARIEFRFYLNGQFVTDSSPDKVQQVLDAYEHLGKLDIESYLYVGTEHQVRGEEGHQGTEEV